MVLRLTLDDNIGCDGAAMYTEQCFFFLEFAADRDGDRIGNISTSHSMATNSGFKCVCVWGGGR